MGKLPKYAPIEPSSTGQYAWLPQAVELPIAGGVQVRIAKRQPTGYARILGLDDIVIVERFDPVEPDRDGDGLPDTWEVLRGLPVGEVDGGSGGDDADGDGASNAREYDAGTDPLDGDSLFAIATIADTGDGGPLAVRVRTEPGRRYAIQYSDAGQSDAATWRDFTNAAIGAGTWVETNSAPSTHVFVDDFSPLTSGAAPPAPRRCYRVRVD